MFTSILLVPLYADPQFFWLSLRFSSVLKGSKISDSATTIIKQYFPSYDLTLIV